MDRFARGFIAGVVAAVVKGGLDWLAYIIHLANHTYAEYTYFLLAGHLPGGAVDFVVGQLLDIGLGGAVGAAFVYYAYRTKNKKSLWFKGVFFAIAVYFLTYMIGTVYRLPVVGVLSTGTVIADFLTSSAYGIVLGHGIYLWGARRGDWGSKPRSAAAKAIQRPPARRIRYEDTTIKEEESGWGHIRKPRRLK